MKRKRKANTPVAKSAPKKMSEILLDFAWTYAIKGQNDPAARQQFMDVACSAWNFSLLPDKDCERVIAAYIDGFRCPSKADDEANMKALENDLRALIAWRKEHYPELRRLVVSAQLYDEPGDKIGCRASSTDYDQMVKSKVIN